MNESPSILDRAATALGEFIARTRDSYVHLSSRFDAGRSYTDFPGTHYHDAARKDRTTADWRARCTSADQAILGDLDTMLARSRMMIANDGYARSAQGGYRRYVIGGGITARSAAKHPDNGTMLETFNKELDRLWNEWFWEPSFCDAEETKTMAEKQGLWMDELFAAGGVFVLHDYMPRLDGPGLVLQEVEYEQRDELRTEYDGRPVRGGVETGQRGQPLAYHLHTAAHPLEEYASVSKRFEASRVSHIFRQDRVRQRLGTPWMRSVLNRIRNLAMYEQYTMTGARTQAGFGGFIKNTKGGTGTIPRVMANRLGATPPIGSANDSDELEVHIQPGLFPVLKEGQEPVFPQHSQPSMIYSPFVAEQLKGISAGTGLDFATVARWYADGNFSSQRQAKLDLLAEVTWIQDILFIRKPLKRIRQQFAELCILEGRLKAVGYFESPRWRSAYLETNWQGPPRYAQDEVKDAASWKIWTSLGLKSPQEFCNREGKDIRDVLEEIAEFRRICEDKGLGELFNAIIGSTLPQEPRPDKKPADEEKKAAGDALNNNGHPNRTGSLAQGIAERIILDHLTNSGDNGHG